MKASVAALVALFVLSSSTERLRVVFIYDAGGRWGGGAPGALYRSRSLRDRSARDALVRRLADHLDPDAAVRVGSVGDFFRLSPSWVRTRSQIDAALESVEQRADPSPIWDAVCLAADALESTDGRRALILVSDGRSRGNERGFAEALGCAKRAEVRVFPVRVRPRLRRGDPEDTSVDPADRLKALAAATGGTFGEPRYDSFPAYIGDLMTRLRVGSRSAPVAR